jgi:hypothetical protein
MRWQCPSAKPCEMLDFQNSAGVRIGPVAGLKPPHRLRQW